MLAPDGAEVAAQEWDVLVVVVVVAIGPLAAVDQGNGGFFVIVVIPWPGCYKKKIYIYVFAFLGMGLLFALSIGSL